MQELQKAVSSARVVTLVMILDLWDLFFFIFCHNIYRLFLFLFV